MNVNKADLLATSARMKLQRRQLCMCKTCSLSNGLFSEYLLKIDVEKATEFRKMKGLKTKAPRTVERGL
jgi:hypothetical protein